MACSLRKSAAGIRTWYPDPNAAYPWPPPESSASRGRKRQGFRASFRVSRIVVKSSAQPDQNGRRTGGREALFGRQGLRPKRKIQLFPHLQQRLGQPVDQGILVIGRGRDPQPLGALGD